MKVIRILRILNVTVSALNYLGLVIMSKLIQDKSLLEIVASIWVGMGLMAVINWFLIFGFCWRD